MLGQWICGKLRRQVHGRAAGLLFRRAGARALNRRKRPVSGRKQIGMNG